MATLSRSPFPVPLLHPLLFFLLLLPTATTLTPAPNHTNVNVDPPFIRPVPLLRQASPNCPCTCSLSNPKITNPCANAPPACLVVRCSPRTFGFSCCDGVRIPESPRTPQAAVPSLRFISMNAEEVVDLNPGLSRMTAEILESCVIQLAELLEDEPNNNGNGAPSRIVLPGSTVRQRGRARFLFRRLIQETSRVLNFVITMLTFHLSK
eukprot:GFKZ01004392.1.p1 GENE.GFKZ01004392.1~~GFKZ01004392.1.p1  ORF type:complete len:208 (-),score=13.48 GFKZ01004392.1:847-1470(-)